MPADGEAALEAARRAYERWRAENDPDWQLRLWREQTGKEEPTPSTPVAEPHSGSPLTLPV